MRGLRETLALAIAVAGLLLAPAANASADLAQITKTGKLRVLVVDEDLFFNLKPGLPGFDREMLEGFAKLHKLTLDVVVLDSWDQMIPSLLENEGDVIVGGYSDTPARREKIAFTAEVFPSRKVVMTRKPHPVVRTLEQFRKETVGTVKGTSMAEAVRAAGVPEENVVYLPTATLPQQMKDGKATAIVLGVEHAIREQRLDPAIELGLFLGKPGSLAFGLRKEDTALREALDQYIQNVRRTETWNRLVIKYLGDAAPEVLRGARSQ